MKYGELPKIIGEYRLYSDEMFFYQYLPIKLQGDNQPKMEDRLMFCSEMIGAICCDFIGEFGLNAYIDSYIYLTAKRLFQSPGCPFNRPGWHSDGFMTSDINYIWYDTGATVFNTSDFNISQDDFFSLSEMESQAMPINNITFPDNKVLRLNQYCIHQCGEVERAGIRTFIKVSFSGDKYDLSGNSHNHLFDYKWEMKKRKMHRNIPQSKISRS